MTGYIPRWFTGTKTVIRPSSNRVQCRATLLIKTKALTTAPDRPPQQCCLYLNNRLQRVTTDQHIRAFTARCTIVQSAVLHVVRLSVTFADQDHIVRKSWKLIARTISPTPSLCIARMLSTYSQGNMGKFWRD